MTPFIRSPYNYDMNAAGDASGLNCKDKSLAQQQFKEESDINTIVERFRLSGELPTNLHMPQNMDFETIFDFQSAMNMIRDAQESFAKLPAKVRYRFHNNPAELVDFVSDAENLQEAIKLGLANPTMPTPAPTPIPPVAPPPDPQE